MYRATKLRSLQYLCVRYGEQQPFLFCYSIHVECSTGSSIALATNKNKLEIKNTSTNVWALSWFRRKWNKFTVGEAAVLFQNLGTPFGHNLDENSEQFITERETIQF